jgi:hypothetical protein
MTYVDDRSFNVFPGGTGPFDSTVAAVARRALLVALDHLDSDQGGLRCPQVRELAAELGVHPRRVARLLEAFGLRDRCRERVASVEMDAESSTV